MTPQVDDNLPRGGGQEPPRGMIIHALGGVPVSYKPLTLPTNRGGVISGVGGSFKKKTTSTYVHKPQPATKTSQAQTLSV